MELQNVNKDMHNCFVILLLWVCTQWHFLLAILVYQNFDCESGCQDQGKWNLYKKKNFLFRTNQGYIFFTSINVVGFALTNNFQHFTS